MTTLLLPAPICRLAPVGCGCNRVNTDGSCSVFYIEGMIARMNKGNCNFRNFHMPKTGIYVPKAAAIKNPLKASKDKAKAKG